MKEVAILCVIVFTGIFLLNLAAGEGYAAAGESWLGIAVFNPVQYPDQSFSVRGLRVNAIYANNKNLSGVDLGLYYNHLKGDLNGFQLSLYNKVEGGGSGLQLGAVNDIGSNFSGVQLGLANFSAKYQKGVQLGIYNCGGHVSGLQLGVLNKAKSLHGLQIGLFNLKEAVGPGIPKSLPMRGFPLINWTFQ
ncbi:MAG: LA_2272 family surface repeat-containing protein [bacterium]